MLLVHNETREKGQVETQRSKAAASGSHSLNPAICPLQIGPNASLADVSLEGARTGQESLPEGGASIRTAKEQVEGTVIKVPKSKMSLADKN
jgi:hypothetical protein